VASPSRIAELATLSKSEFALFLRAVDADRLHPLRAKGLGISMLASIILPIIFSVLLAGVVLIGFKTS
jgi:hypothetical protein